MLIKNTYIYLNPPKPPKIARVLKRFFKKALMRKLSKIRAILGGLGGFSIISKI